MYVSFLYTYVHTDERQLKAKTTERFFQGVGPPRDTRTALVCHGIDFTNLWNCTGGIEHLSYKKKIFLQLVF